MTTTTRQSPDPMLLHVMLTVAAIIQGVAFTEVVQSPEFKMLHLGSTMSTDDWLRILQVAAMFAVPVVVWFGQVVNCVGYSLWPRQYFGFLDALLPFAFGIIEVKLAQRVDTPASWCLWLSGFYGLLVVAWADFYRKIERRIALNGESFGANFPRFKHLNSASAVGLFVTFLLLSWYDFAPLWSRFVLFGGVVSLAMVTAFSLKRMWEDLKFAPAAEHHLASGAAASQPTQSPSATRERVPHAALIAAVLGLMAGAWVAAQVNQATDKPDLGD